MKKVCHLSSVHQLNDIRIFHKQCASLAADGYDVTLIACNAAVEQSSRVRLIGLSEKKTRLKRMLFGAYQTYKLAKKQEVDIYHFHDPELLPYGLLLKIKTGARVVYDSHECYSEFFLQKEWLPLYLRKVVSLSIKILENFVVKRIDLVIAATPHIANRFQSNAPCVATIKNYALKNEFACSHSVMAGKRDGFCYVGAISKVRGILPLMDSLDNIEPDIKFYLAGTFTELDIEVLVKEHRNWHRVTFVGQVSREQVAAIYRKSFAGIVTLLPAPNHLFSLPIKLFEYMSAGIPVVGSNIQLWENIIKKGDCGICVDPSSPEDIAAAINRIHGDVDLQKMFSKNGRSLVQTTYSWDSEASKLLASYREIAGDI